MGRRKDLEKKAAWDEQYKETNRIMSNFRHQELRHQFFDMYGSKCSCSECDESNEWFLTLDHTNNDGYIARSKGKQNLGIYRDAVKEYRPDLYQILCFNCNCGEDKNGGICPHFGINEKAISRQTNKTKLTDKQKIQIRKRYKRWSRTDGVQALAKELGVCAETIENIVRKDSSQMRHQRSLKAKKRRLDTKSRFLEMYGAVCACPGCDEINKGFLTLDHINNDGAKETSAVSYKQAVEEYSPDLYQPLCFNCNCGKNRNNEVCPHIEITKEKIVKITGEKHKLNPEIVRQIRKRHEQYSRVDGTRALAKEFCVSVATIEDVVYNRSWKDATYYK